MCFPTLHWSPADKPEKHLCSETPLTLHTFLFFFFLFFNWTHNVLENALWQKKKTKKTTLTQCWKVPLGPLNGSTRIWTTWPPETTHKGKLKSTEAHRGISYNTPLNYDIKTEQLMSAYLIFDAQDCLAGLLSPGPPFYSFLSAGLPVRVLYCSGGFCCHSGSFCTLMRIPWKLFSLIPSTSCLISRTWTQTGTRAKHPC